MLAPELTPEQRLYEQVQEGVRATCPCCGYPTINGRGAFDICSLCDWEDDGQDEPEHSPYPGYYTPDQIAGGPNHDYSLSEARENFAQYLTMYRPADEPFESHRGRTDVKRRIVEAYDRAVDGEVTFAEADADASSLFGDSI